MEVVERVTLGLGLLRDVPEGVLEGAIDTLAVVVLEGVLDSAAELVAADDADVVLDAAADLEVEAVAVAVRLLVTDAVLVREAVVVLDTDVEDVLVLVGRPDTVGPGELVPDFEAVAVRVLVRERGALRDTTALAVGAVVAAVLRVPVAVLVAVRDKVAVRVGRICSTRRVRGGPTGTSMESQPSG